MTRVNHETIKRCIEDMNHNLELYNNMIMCHTCKIFWVKTE